MAVGCGAKCAKFLLIIFNIIFWLSGCALMVVGILLVLDKQNKALLDLLDIGEQEPLLRIAAYFFIGVGVFVFIVGFFGCCGAVQELKGCLITYFLLLVIILAAEVAAAILAIVYKSDIESTLKTNLKDSIRKEYDGDPLNPTTVYWDKVQSEFACCGVEGAGDYKDSLWYKNGGSSVNGAGGGNGGDSTGGTFLETKVNQAVEGINAEVANTLSEEVPLSCCKLQADSTPDDEKPQYVSKQTCQGTAGRALGEEQLQAARNTKGCYGEVEQWFSDNSTIVIGVGIGIGCLEIFGMIFAICLCRNLSSDM